MTPLFVRNQSAERAFERMYKAHVRDIYCYALMVTRNPDDAEDVVQTTFLKAFRAFGAGERPRNARHWLIKIAHNTCRTRIRDAKRRPQEVALEERLVEAVNTHEYEGVRPTELLRALGELTFNQRAGLVMRELEGRSYAEIAEVLELSGSAVETLLFRARRALREQLDGSLECGEAELALSRDLDGRLNRDERVQLRAHLRACRECAGLARRQRARRAALGALGPVPLPSSLASWGGGASAGTGLAAKVAAVVAAGAAAAGAGYEVAEAVPESAPYNRGAVVAAANGSRAEAANESKLAAVFGRDLRRVSTRAPRVAADMAVDAARVVSAGTSAHPQATEPAASTTAAVVAPVTAVVVSQLPALPRALPAAPVPVPAVPPAPPISVAAAPPVPAAPALPPVVPALP